MRGATASAVGPGSRSGRALSLLLPHWFAVRRHARRDRARRARVAALLASAARPERTPFDYEAAIALLVGRGVEESVARIGSIGEQSLEFVRAVVRSSFDGAEPLRVLHVGNFLGVSLAALSSAALDVHPDSLTVSIDPNIPHLGVAEPQSHVVAVLAHFGLLRSNLVLCGYTLEKTPGTDGVEVAGYDAAAAWEEEPAPENVLENLRRLAGGFTVALLDGSHIGAHARRELASVSELLRPGALVFLDDVSEAWTEIQALYSEAGSGSWPFEAVDYDGRVGVLRRLS